MKRIENQDTSPESQTTPYGRILDTIKKFSDDVFFIQTRYGKGGKKFQAYKIRTMIHDADIDIPIEALKGNKQEDDPRILPKRNWMRASGFDELPQIINILKGDMSIFGSRPLSEAAYGYMTEIQKKRTEKYKPGIFGGYAFVGKESETRLQKRGKRTIRENQHIYLKLREIKAGKSIIHLSLYHLYILRENLKAIKNGVLK